MSKLTIALFIIWPMVFVFWVVMLLLPDPNVWGSVIGMFVAVFGLIGAFGRRKVELQRSDNRSFPILH